MLCPFPFLFIQGKLENYKEAATRVLLHWNQTILMAQEAFRILREALLELKQNRTVAEVLDAPVAGAQAPPLEGMMLMHFPHLNANCSFQNTTGLF